MNAIFAVNAINGFGTGNDMPWPRSSSDLQRFKQLTSNSTVIMGSGTWHSNMPKPLPNRRNIVLSSSLIDERCEVFTNVTELLMSLNVNETTFVIGGAKVLWMLRMFIDTVYLTRFKSMNTCEITLDTTKYLEDFSMISSEDFGDHVFETYKRKS